MADPSAVDTSQTVTVKAGDKLYDMPKENVDAFSKSIGGGVHVLTPDEVAQHEADKQKKALEQKYSGVGDKAAALGIGAADMLTLGLGSGIAGAVGGESARKYLREQAQANPGWETAGGVAGAILPAVLTGGGSLLGEAGEGLGLAGRALGAGGEALGGLGSAAEGMVGRGATSVMGRALQTGGGMALSGALQGGAYGAGSAVSEDIINDRELTAEHLLAGAAKGLGYGALLGGGLGLAGSLAGSAGTAALARLSRAGEDLSSEGGLVGKLGLRASGARVREINRMLDKGIDPAEVGQALVEEAPKYSDKPFMAMTKEDMRDAAKKWADDLGQQVGAARDDLARMAEEKGALPNVKAIGDRIQSEVIAPLQKTPGFQSEVNQLQGYLADFLDKGETATFKDLNAFRKALDTKVFKGGKAPPPDSILDEMRSVRSILEDEFEQQGATVGGKDWLERYKGTKANFSTAAEARNMTEKGARAEAGRNTIGLSDMIAAGAGFAHAGPVGLLAGVGHHVAKEYGMQFAADLLNRASKIQSIQALAAKGDKQLEAGVSRFLTGAKEKASSAIIRTGASREEDFAQRSKHIQKLASSPDLMVSHIQHTQPPADAAPKTATAYAQKQSSAIAYLASQIPHGAPVNSLIPTVKGKPGKQEQAKWLDKLAVYDDPIGTVTKELQKGTLTRDHVDALKAMYPAMYGDLQKKAMGQLAEMAAEGKTPDFYKAQQLGTLLGIPASASQDPAFIHDQQMLYSQQNQAASQSVGQPPSTPQHVRGAREDLGTGEDALGDTT